MPKVRLCRYGLMVILSLWVLLNLKARTRLLSPIHVRRRRVTDWDRFPSVSFAIAKAREYYGSNQCTRTVMRLSKSFDASLLHEGVWDVTHANDGVTDPAAVEVTRLI